MKNTQPIEHQTGSEKKASNFELNRIKLGKYDIQLYVGDRFITNGFVFNYKPCKNSDGAKVLGFYGYRRETAVSAKKYKKDVLKADNIELLSRRVIGFETEEEARKEEEDRKAEGWKASYYEEYEVKYVYQQLAESSRLEKLICLYITSPMLSETKMTFKVKELEVDRDTKETIFLKEDQPITYRRKIDKDDIGVVINPHHQKLFKSNDRLICCYIDQYDEAHTKLFAAYEQLMKNRIIETESLVEKAKITLINFEVLKAEQGF